MYFEPTYTSLSSLSWETEVYRPQDLRPGPFSNPGCPQVAHNIKEIELYKI